MSDATVLDTMTALVAACTTTFAGSATKVVDGPATTKTAETQRLFVGTSDDGTGIAAEGDQPGETLPGMIDMDNFSIMCIAEAWTGSGEAIGMNDARTRAFGIRNTVRELLRPNAIGITLGVNALAWALLGAWNLTQIQDEQGAYARITFRIECQCRPGIN